MYYILDGGTTTIARHLSRKHGITKESCSVSASRSRQTQLHGYASEMPGTGMPFSYNRNTMIDEFSRYVIGDEMPFMYEESKNFEYFTRVSLQPQFRAVSRNTLKRRTQVLYQGAKAQLIEMFRNLDNHVSLTTDTWSSCFGEPYMCVTAHWIDENWYLQKHTIAFEVMEEKHTEHQQSYDGHLRNIICAIKYFLFLLIMQRQTLRQ